MPQPLVSHSMGAMDIAEQMSSSLIGGSCDGKGREEGISEGKKQGKDNGWEEDDTGWRKE